MSFFRVFLASFFGVITAFLLLFVVFLFVLGALSAFVSFSSKDTTSSIDDNSVLSLNLNKVIRDRTSPIEEELMDILGLDFGQVGLNKITDAIERARDDDRIKGLVLKSGFPQAGWTQIATVRDALEDFKSSGKFIYAHDEFYTQRGYYLSSVADTLAVHPMGIFSFKGLVAEVLYYKDIQDKYGIRMEIIRNGRYKSAGEPYLTNQMSPENRTQLSELLFDIWNGLREDIAESRNLTENRIDQMANDLEAGIVQEALALGLIDTLVNKEGFDLLVKEKLGIQQDDSIERVSLNESRSLNRVRSTNVDHRIAVVYAQGIILLGDGFEGTIGSRSICKTLRTIKNRKSVKGVVLRINSPGGSALASEIIWQCVEDLKEEKPVVVSMGDVAASGGYYVAAGAHQIMADPKTITGSIGVVFSLLNAKDFFDDIGINAQHVTTHDNALDYSPFVGIQSGFRSVQIKEMDKIYTTFKERVAQGRGMTLDQIEEIAQGRVWSGKQALEIGLVDAFGDLSLAIEKAAELAELTDYSITEYPRFESTWESYFNALQGVYRSKTSQAPFIDTEMTNRLMDEIDKLKLVQDGPQTVLPFYIQLR
ncbi:MAG: signal peptide peptidase SppA [Flavobacteriaceae bacterium]|nr:signal peptide peptidase SppA [Flavobacteriaceae bacterium]MCY4253852.1 signal peptide peptidase SppA [Flavobacteriaceae bacterium]